MFYERPNNVAACLPVGIRQSCFNLGGEVFQPAYDEPYVRLQGSRVPELLGLLLKMRHPLAQAGQAGLKLTFVDHCFGIAINQASYSLAELAYLFLYAGESGVLLRCLRL